MPGHQYFSSLERLRLAHDGAASPVHRSTRSRTRSTLTATTKSLWQTLEHLPSLPYIHPGHKRRTASHVAETLINPDTAAWFASLPSAVRRKHFTKEEQILFANERQNIILDAADELLQRQRRRSLLDTDLIYLSPSESSHSSGSSIRYSFETLPDIDQLAGFKEMASQQYLNSLKFLDTDHELDLRLDDYHTAIVETAQRQAAPPPRFSYRRNMSLSTMSLRRTSISSPTKSSSRAPSMYLNRLQTPTTPQRPSFHHAPRASVSTMDMRATHYQDPAARMKLRVYLASPSKFDEAVEFGFPSMTNTPSKMSDRPMTSPRRTNESGRSFHSDDVPSLAGDDASSHDEAEAQTDPRTPDESEFRNIRRSQKSSGDHPSTKPHVVRSEPYAHSNTLDREMTIHMTLTRPDLRAPTDTRPSSRHINSQPLEQAPLPPLDNSASIWDTLPAPEESKVKKLWRRLKLI